MDFTESGFTCLYLVQSLQYRPNVIDLSFAFKKNVRGVRCSFHLLFIIFISFTLHSDSRLVVHVSTIGFWLPFSPNQSLS